MRCLEWIKRDNEAPKEEIHISICVELQKDIKSGAQGVLRFEEDYLEQAKKRGHKWPY